MKYRAISGVCFLFFKKENHKKQTALNVMGTFYYMKDYAIKNFVLTEKSITSIIVYKKHQPLILPNSVYEENLLPAAAYYLVCCN
jgi:hypothetical protein